MKTKKLTKVDVVVTSALCVGAIVLTPITVSTAFLGGVVFLIGRKAQKVFRK